MANIITLDTKLSQIQGILPKFLTKLKKLGLETVRDLLWHFPARYEDYSRMSKIADLKVGQQVTLRGEVKRISSHRAWNKHMMIVEALITDETGGVQLVWFNQPFISKVLKVGTHANFAGKVFAPPKGGLSIANPSYEILKGTTSATHTAGLVPVYPETRGLTSKGFRYLIKTFLDVISRPEDFIPEHILEENHLPDLNLALHKIHFPRLTEQVERAKKRFAFEYLFLLQLNSIKTREQLAKEKALALAISDDEVAAVVKKLPFTLTESQQRSLNELMSDMNKGTPMNRLLQGDVGSGKTVIVAVAAVLAAQKGKQAVFMAPTEVLARQHYHTLTTIFEHLTCGVGILTGSEARVFYEKGLEEKKSRAQFIKDVENGSIKIIIGTHALIARTKTDGTQTKTDKTSPKMKFKNLALVIIDEQHRFGVAQRASLIARTKTDGTRTNIDKKPGNGSKLLHEELTYNIRKCIFTIKDTLGYGHKETIYQEALAEEFRKNHISFEQEKIIDVTYNKKKIGTYRPDFVIDDKVIVELKTLTSLSAPETKQTWTYLQGSPYELALLVNFGPHGADIKRIIKSKNPPSPSQSVSSPETSVPSGRFQSVSSPETSALPHFLSMSATPIPRTLSLAAFGDLDVSTINELPKGRKPIITKVVDPANRLKAYGFIRDQIATGRQAFFIYPRIEPQTNTDGTQTETDENLFHSASSRSQSVSSPETSVLTVKAEYEKLSKIIFPKLKVAVLHGKMPVKEKHKVMTDFKAGKIDLLVSTSVIEVGVDVPNATIMVIEGAERFGLAQLYQFRGRVGRGEHQSFCLLFTDSTSQSTADRLNALLTAKNGFELAEMDLALRGPGEFLGERQTGLPDLAMHAMNNAELIKAAQDSARELLTTDPNLSKYPLLKTKLDEVMRKVHLE